MKKIVYKSPYISDNFYYFLLLLFMQFLVLMIFIIIVTTSIFQIDFLLDILLLLLSYFQLRAIKNAIVYFFPYEEYTIVNDRLYYEKKLKILKKFFILKKFNIKLDSIISILDLPPKKFFYTSGRGFQPLKYIYYFKPCERICIKTEDQKKYVVCNYARKPNSFDIYANNKETEKEFKIIFQNIKNFIENEKNKHLWVKKYTKIKIKNIINIKGVLLDKFKDEHQKEFNLIKEENLSLEDKQKLAQNLIERYLRENGYEGEIPEVLLTDEAHSFSVDSKDKETGAKRREKIYFSINDIANPNLAFSKLFAHEKAHMNTYDEGKDGEETSIHTREVKTRIKYLQKKKK